MGEVIELEQWRDVKGFESAYQVSNLGRVKSLPRIVLDRKGRIRHVRGGLLSLRRRKASYPAVCLHAMGVKKSRRVHRLVAEAFLEKPQSDGLQICHKNGKADDNRASNLRWGTPQSNANDKFRHGTVLFGESHASAKLDDATCLEVIAAQGTQRAIGKLFGISHTHVYQLKHGKRRAYLHPAYLPEETKIAA